MLTCIATYEPSQSLAMVLFHSDAFQFVGNRFHNHRSLLLAMGALKVGVIRVVREEDASCKQEFSRSDRVVGSFQ